MTSDQKPRLPLLRWVDGLGEVFGRVGDVMVILIAILLTYEVVARYVFLAPTQWTQDVSTTLQIWFTYLGMAMVLRSRQMIRISALLAISPAWLRYVLEALGLFVIAAFSAIAIVKGFEMMWDSILLGRRQPTMISMPNWVAELPIVVGFTLLFLQSLCDLIRLPFGPAPSFSPGGEHDLDSAPEQRT